MIKLKPLLVNLFIPLAVGGISALLTTDSMEEYAELRQPPLSPPGWLFPVVWTALFIMMGVAAYLVWMRDSTGRNGALLVYGIQLALNFSWTLVFFNAGQHGIALIIIVILWAFILLNVIKFFKESIPAGWLLVPYLLWVTFATYLNFGVWYLN